MPLPVLLSRQCVLHATGAVVYSGHCVVYVGQLGLVAGRPHHICHKPERRRKWLHAAGKSVMRASS